MTDCLAVIRGGAQAQQQRTKVDWVNATYLPGRVDLPALTRAVGRALGRKTISLRPAPAVLGFQFRYVLLTGGRRGAGTSLGCIAVGNEAQGGRSMLQLTGSGCAQVADWAALSDLLANLGARLTRVDIALDLPDGEVGVDDVHAMLRQGEFDIGGKRPAATVAGDWLEGQRGRTLYLGSPQNGKLLRAYEKGKKEGDLTSRWVRLEVQYGNRDRLIPLEVLTDPDPYFAGAYPALGRILAVAPRHITARKRATVASLSRKLYHLRASYGAVIAQAMLCAGADEKKLIEAVQWPVTQAKTGATATPTWSEVQDDLARLAASRTHG